VGNNTAIGEFYYKEMAYKRKHHAESVLTGDRSLVGGGLAWLGNAALMATTGYGEHPLRTVGTSVVIVVGFAGLFHFALIPSLSPSEALLFSFQNFITFLIGTAPQRTTLAVTAVSIVQGFLGAFFVALFVYVFTRRLNR